MSTPVEFAQAVISARRTGYIPGATIGFSFMTAQDYLSTDYSFIDGHPQSTGDFLTAFTPFTEAQKRAVREIFSILESFLNLRFVEVGSTEVGPNIRFGSTAQSTSGGVSIRDSSFLQGLGWMTGINDILISTQNQVTLPGSYGYATLIHEIGHALGLKHPHEAEPGQPALLQEEVTRAISVMSYEDSPAQPGVFGRTPLLLEVRALQDLYGVRTAAYGSNPLTAHFGKTDYLFVPTDGAVQQFDLTTIGRGEIRAVWDGGGEDTFDASRYTNERVEIRLEPGELSSIGRQLNIAVAFGSEIENAKGGGGDDLLIGSHGRNKLYGNGGKDTLLGGNEVDELHGGSDDDVLDGGEGADLYFYEPNDGEDRIVDSDSTGRIRVGNAELAGGKGTPEKYLWVDAQSSVSYRYIPSGAQAGSKGRLVISGQALGGTGNQITIENYTRSALGVTDGFGLTFTADEKVEVVEGRAANPWREDPTHSQKTGVEVASTERLAGSFTVALSAAIDVAQTVRIKLDALADKFLAILGDETVRFTNGEIELSVAPGQTVVSFALLADRDVDTDATIGLTAELLDAQSSPVASHAISLALDATEEPDDPQTTNTILGDQDPLASNYPTDILAGTFGNDRIEGRSGDDQLGGGPGGDDWILGGAGADRLWGHEGRDRLEGGAGSDALDGGSDDDLLEGGEGSDWILLGGAGDDRLFAGTETDFAAAFDTDAIEGGSESEWLFGGDGRDTLVGQTGADVLTGGAGEDLLLGGAGADFLYGDSDLELAGVDQFAVGEINLAGAADTLFGGGGDDELAGEVGADTLLGGGGADLLFGDSNALAFAYHGDDFLDGGAGNDVLHGQGGNDSLLGGAGDDVLQGDDPGHPQGDDYLDGEDGDDTLIGGGGADVLSGGAGADVLAGDGDNVPNAEQGADELYGEAGDDLLQGYGGEDFLDGGEGADTLIGGLGRDTLYGGADNDAIAGDEGGTSQAGDADLLFGEAGDDVLGGQGGADQLYGGDGDDQLSGGDGDDFLSGGEGQDVLLGDAGADLISGEAGADQASGGDGDDVIFGGDDNDLLLGDAGADELNGEDGDDTLQGGDGDDVLVGGDGADVLSGGDGADQLLGGAGADILTGGAGDDIYEVSLAEGDQVVDAEGENVIRILDATADSLSAEGVTIDGQFGVLLKSDPAATSGVFVQGGLTLLDASNPIYELAGGTVVSHAALMEEIYTASALLTGTAVGDALKGYAGADLIQGLDGDDWLSGGSADDVLEGGEGDDELIGGAGADILRGGLGDDTYTADAADTLEELADEGTDTVLADSTYTLGANLENLSLTGEAAIDATGNALGNALTGNAAANVLTGGAGDDALAGGAGDDEYVFSAGDGFDTIDDALGMNSIRFGTGIEGQSLTVDRYVGDDGATYLEIGYGAGGDKVAVRDGLLGRVSEYRFADGTVRTHEDILASLGALAIEGSDGADTIIGGASPDVLDGGAGADQLFGRGADDVLRGGDGEDALWGEAGNDVLDGGPGADALAGGVGEDTYLVTWDMGEDTIQENAEELNHLRLGAAVAFEDLVASRQGDDLVLSLRGGSNRLTLAGYYVAPQDWLVTDSASEIRTLAEVIAQSPAGPPDPVEAEIASYKARVLREFYATKGFAVLDGETLERTFSQVTGSQSDSTHSTYVLQEVVRASDDGFIGRETPSSDLVSETTVTVSTITVYQTAPGSRTVAAGLAAHGASNDIGWRYVPVGQTAGASMRQAANGIGVAKEAGAVAAEGFWVPTGGGVSFPPPTLPGTVSWTLPVTHVFTEETLTLNLEEIRAGEGDNVIQTTDYSVVDAGAGNDYVYVVSAPDYVLADGPGNRGRIGSLLYGNDGDDSLNGGDGNDLLIGGSGFDRLYGGAGGDRYLAAGEGFDIIADSGEDLDRYRAAYYSIANFPDLVLREDAGGRYVDQDVDIYGLIAGGGRPSQSEVQLVFDTPEDGLAHALESPRYALQIARAEYVRMLRGDGPPTDPNGNGPDYYARYMRQLEAQIGFEQGRYLRRFTYVEPLPPLPPIAGNDHAAIEPYYDVMWVDTIALAAGWSLANLMVSTDVVDGEAETLYLDRPDGAGVTIALARGTDPIGTGVERFAFADGSAYTIRQILDLENQDRTIIGTAGEDSLTGGRGDDTLIGLAGADYLYGRLGDDLLQGGAGSDYYDYDAGADVIEDLDPTGSDFDGVYLIGIAPEEVSASFDSGILRFDFAGSSDSLSIRWDRAAGYGVEEVAFDDGTVWDQAMLDSLAAPPLTIITGTSGAETLTGTSGRDEISGLGGDDVLFGLGGADYLDGGTGADQMSGGPGDDTYVVNDAGDQVLENPDEGVDTVEASLSFTLPAELENLTLTGGGNPIGTGNALANVLTGNSGANTLDGGDGADTLAGGPGADTLLGGAGDDTFLVAGDEGPDTFDGGSGFDTVLGSAGDDVIRVANLSAANGIERIDGGGGVNTLAGTAGNNTIDLSGIEVLNVALIDGGAGSDAITGSSGADTIQGGAGADTLAGGAGDDTFLVTGDEGPDTFDGGTGFDTVLGSAGDDVIRVAGLSAANNVERIDGGAGTNVIAGTAGNNTIDLSGIEVLNVGLIDGGAGSDTITGTAGADAIQGGTGADVLAGGAGDDTFLVTGDEGPDTFDGGTGFDTVLGSAGDDVIRVAGLSGANNVERVDGGGGANTLAGTAGNNTIDLSSVDVLNIALIDGGAGDDTITGTAGADAIQGGAGADTLSGGAGDDLFLVVGDEGPDTFDGGTGFDSVLGSSGDDVIRVSGFGPANGVERIDGAGGYNLVAGTAGNNTIDLSATQLLAIAVIDGGAGSDTITGSASADTILGGTGADTLRGGAGDDIFLISGTDSAADTVGGDAGFDAILGSVGDDTFRFSSYGGMNSVERIDGAGGVDTIAGTAGNNTLDFSASELLAIGKIDGGAGNDTVTGSAGADFITGGDGTDTLRGEGGNDLVQGGLGNDTLVETAGTNLLDGGAGTDAITGGAGAEFIAGGTGNDTVNPGAGADVLAFNTGDGQDTVNPGTGANKTLSLGGGIRYEDLAFRKSANDLIVETSATEQVTLKNWYAAPANQGFVTLQVIAEAMAGYSQSSPDPLRDDKVETFNFGALVSTFDAARAADPMISRWAMMNALLDAHLAGSDDAALGGDLAYQYGMTGTLAGIGTGAAQDVLGSSQFGTQAQQLRPLATLQEGAVKLG